MEKVNLLHRKRRAGHQESPPPTASAISHGCGSCSCRSASIPGGSASCAGRQERRASSTSRAHAGQLGSSLAHISGEAMWRQKELPLIPLASCCRRFYSRTIVPMVGLASSRVSGSAGSFRMLTWRPTWRKARLVVGSTSFTEQRRERWPRSTLVVPSVQSSCACM